MLSFIEPISEGLNPMSMMRTTCRLVKMNSLSYFEPIRRGVRKSSLICKFVMQHFQRLVKIGSTSEHFMIMNQSEIVLKGQVPRGLKTYYCSAG